MQLLHSHRTSLDVLVALLSSESESSVYPRHLDGILEYAPILT